MISDIDRQKVFWLLKKYSSFTAWNALAQAYFEFAAQFEFAALHPVHASKETTEDEFNEFIDWVHEFHLKPILDGQIAFEKGLARLHSGDKSVFLRTHQGEFAKAIDSISFIERIMDPTEFVFDWMPNQTEVVAAAQYLSDYSQQCLGLRAVLAFPRQKGMIATFNNENVFDPVFDPMQFPADLPPPPPPSQTTIASEVEVPVSGIWEPFWAAPENGDSQPVSGCPFYLVAGRNAPSYRPSSVAPPMAVTWRLLWEDHRYEDGTIPPEEAEYLTTPLSTSAPEQAPQRLRGQPGEVVPRSGWWYTPALKGTDGFRPFEAGEHFPGTQTTEWGSVIWYWDQDKQPAE